MVNNCSVFKGLMPKYFTHPFNDCIAQIATNDNTTWSQDVKYVRVVSFYIYFTLLPLYSQ